MLPPLHKANHPLPPARVQAQEPLAPMTTTSAPESKDKGTPAMEKMVGDLYAVHNPAGR